MLCLATTAGDACHAHRLLIDYKQMSMRQHASGLQHAVTSDVPDEGHPCGDLHPWSRDHVCMLWDHASGQHCCGDAQEESPRLNRMRGRGRGRLASESKALDVGQTTLAYGVTSDLSAEPASSSGQINPSLTGQCCQSIHTCTNVAHKTSAVCISARQTMCLPS